MLTSCSIGSNDNLPPYDPPAIAPSRVQPPEIATVDQQIEDEDLDKLPPLTQPPQLKAMLEAIAQGPLEKRIALLKRKALKDLVFVEGGRFEMGDWGYVTDADAHPQHPVQLTGFYISRYKVTYAEFDTYTEATGTPRTAEGRGIDRKNRHPLVPAGAVWQRARDYCQWLGQITDLPFDLPTEAQWEYAARSRGQLFANPTDNGKIEHGRNVPDSFKHAMMLHPLKPEVFAMYPIGMFPPSPLGFYDMAGNGTDWMLDWYDPDYYKHSPVEDPKGPETGIEKVLRGHPVGDGFLFGGVSMTRRSNTPEALMKDFAEDKKTIIMVPGPVANSGLRCVVNTDKPLSKP